MGALALVVPLACVGSISDPAAGVDGSGGRDDLTGEPGDDLLFVPEGLPNANVNGTDVGLVLAAFTLAQGATGPELFAAVRNDGDAPACQPGMTVDFYDQADQRVSSAGGVLQSGRLYQLDDGTIIPCIAPGQTAMAAATALPDAIVIDELGHLEHLFPAFVLDGIVPVAGLAVSGVAAVATDAGHVYTGQLTNGLDVTVRAPQVLVFPVNRVGRPLGVAMSRGTADLPAGGSRTFETSSVDTFGVDFVAFPVASIPTH